MSHGKSLFNAVLIILIVLFVAFVIYPIFQRDHYSHRKSSCQSNMKELGTALQLYHGDYGATLPSSGINAPDKWDATRYKHFATQLGVVPPPKCSANGTWVTYLYPYLRCPDIVWCPRITIHRFLTWEWQHVDNIPKNPKPTTTVSYWYKAAVDVAWFGGPDSKGPICRREGDFDFPADQIVFYENAGSHWMGQEKDGLIDGVIINCTFMDGHVAAKRIKSSSNRRGQADPLAPGEPGWYNYDFMSNKDVKPGRHWNPQVYGDMLP